MVFPGYNLIVVILAPTATDDPTMSYTAIVVEVIITIPVAMLVLFDEAVQQHYERSKKTAPFLATSELQPTLECISSSMKWVFFA